MRDDTIDVEAHVDDRKKTRSMTRQDGGSGHHWLIGGHGDDSHLAVNYGFNKCRGIGTSSVPYFDQQYFTPVLVMSRRTNDDCHLRQRLCLAAPLRPVLSFSSFAQCYSSIPLKGAGGLQVIALSDYKLGLFSGAFNTMGFLLMFDCGMSGSRNICTYYYKSLLEWLDCFSLRGSDSSRWLLLTTGVSMMKLRCISENQSPLGCLSLDL